ncbi:MAG TPA: hypothetical protein VFI41_05440 [Gemmatimonadales bacterium]|nr:hypothetical protein [Gemmatimonadales bacterium]
MRVKEYIRQVRKSYRWYQRYVGTTVTWYEFYEETSVPTNIYDESPVANWHPGFLLPVMVVIRDEDREAPREEGFYTGGSIHLTFGTDMAARNGMTDPHDAVLHLKDRFYWDQQYWTVERFQISGRLKKFEVVVGCDARRLGAEELVNQINFPPA